MRAKPTANSSSHPIAPARRPTISDVAAAADVSLGTVSAVLNGKGRISEGTRERVRQAILTLGYRPDLYASNLARRQTNVLGVIVSSLQNPFFAETAQAVEDEARRHGHQVSLMTTNFSPAQHRQAVQQLLSARIAGLAVLTSEHDAASQKLIFESGIRAILLDVGRPQGRCSILRVDAAGGMRAAVEHLIALGHRKLLYVRNSQGAGGPPFRSHRLRDRGFDAAIRAVTRPRLITNIIDVHGPGADAGSAAIDAAWGKLPFTAVIAMTDMVALGVYRALHARGVRIPEDISVVGFDNTQLSRFLSPPLTTVDVPRDELSRNIVHALTADDDRGTLLHLRTPLILRASTARKP